MSEPPALPANNEPRVSRFLVSFTLVPGAMILLGLAIVVGFCWLTSAAADPEQLVDTIEYREGNVRWRAAVSLAGLLADPDHAEVRRNQRLAVRLTEILRRELQSGSARPEEATLRIFLCRAVGEFQSDVSLPVLVQATSSRHNSQVRRSAIEAIALLAATLGSEPVDMEPGLKDSLFTASRDADPQVRLSAAYALGVLGGSRSEDRLAAMLLDENALVRYNAATGLARWGNPAAVSVLLEMLAPDRQSPVGGTQPDGQQDLIQVNALEAISQLLTNNPDLSRDEIRRAVLRLEKATESRAVQAKIGELRTLLSAESPNA